MRDAQARRALRRGDRRQPARDAAQRQRAARGPPPAASRAGRQARSRVRRIARCRPVRAVGDERRAEHPQASGVRHTGRTAVAQRAGRPSARSGARPAARVASISAVVADARRAARDARHAAEAGVPVAHGLRRQADLPRSARSISRMRPRGESISSPHSDVRGARRQAEAAVHAVVEQRALVAVVQVERDVGGLGAGLARGGGGGATRRAPERHAAGLVGEAARRERARGVELPLHGAHELRGDGIERRADQRVGGGGRAAQRGVPAERLDVRAQRAHRARRSSSRRTLADADAARAPTASAPAGPTSASRSPRPARRHADAATDAVAVPRPRSRARPSAHPPRRPSSTRAPARAPPRSPACRSAPSALDSHAHQQRRRRATPPRQAAGATGAVRERRARMPRRPSGVARLEHHRARRGRAADAAGTPTSVITASVPSEPHEELARGRSRRRSSRPGRRCARPCRRPARTATPITRSRGAP